MSHPLPDLLHSRQAGRQSDLQDHTQFFSLQLHIPAIQADVIFRSALFNYQAKIIRDLAKEESCVIIGRCAADLCSIMLRDCAHIQSAEAEI